MILAQKASDAGVLLEVLHSSKGGNYFQGILYIYVCVGGWVGGCACLFVCLFVFVY